MLSALVYSQYCPGRSWVHRLDPRCKWLLLFLLTASLFMIERPLVLILLALGLAVVPWSAGISRRLYLPAVAGMLPLAALSLVFQAGWGPAPHWGWLSLAGLEAGGSLALRLLQLALLAQLLVLTTSPIAMCDALEWMLWPLGRLGLPRRDLALAFTLAWRFIPVLALEGERLLKAQLSRGATWNEGSWWGRLQTLLGLLTPLLVRCFRYSEELAVALESRGYGLSEQPATRLHPLRWRARDTLALMLVVGTCIGLLWSEHA